MKESLLSLKKGVYHNDRQCMIIIRAPYSSAYAVNYDTLLLFIFFLG